MINGYLLGVDVGTTSTKVVIVEPSGKILSQCSSEHELSVARPGWTEEDPRDWWKGLVRAVKRCLSESSIEAARIAGIGVSGQIPTMVLVDEKGEPTRKAILYSDSRAVDEMLWMRKTIDDEDVFKITG